MNSEMKPGTKYKAEEHAASEDGPGVVKGIQFVMRPLLISGSLVVVMMNKSCETWIVSIEADEVLN